MSESMITSDPSARTIRASRSWSGAGQGSIGAAARAPGASAGQRRPATKAVSRSFSAAGSSRAEPIWILISQPGASGAIATAVLRIWVTAVLSVIAARRPEASEAPGRVKPVTAGIGTPVCGSMIGSTARSNQTGRSPAPIL